MKFSEKMLPGFSTTSCVVGGFSRDGHSTIPWKSEKSALMVGAKS